MDTVFYGKDPLKKAIIHKKLSINASKMNEINCSLGFPFKRLAWSPPAMTRQLYSDDLTLNSFAWCLLWVTRIELSFVKVTPGLEINERFIGNYSHFHFPNSTRIGSLSRPFYIGINGPLAYTSWGDKTLAALSARYLYVSVAEITWTLRDFNI